MHHPALDRAFAQFWVGRVHTNLQQRQHATHCSLRHVWACVWACSLAIVAGSWLSAGDSSGAGMAIAFEPATTALVSFMLLKETDTAGTYRSLLLIVSGTALASIGAMRPP
eukprot:SAG11_NODE_456_length_9319_cov_5.131128_10_plen_111_part_00